MTRDSTNIGTVSTFLLTKWLRCVVIHFFLSVDAISIILSTFLHCFFKKTLELHIESSDGVLKN